VRILLSHRYFWPDTAPYASILLQISKALQSAGHEVVVFSAMPSYTKAGYKTAAARQEDSVDGIKIHRVSLLSENCKLGKVFRLINYLYFPFRFFLFQLKANKHDVVMCSTIPTVTMGLFSLLGAKLRGSKFYYHCMDLHPEIGALSGEFKNPILYRVLLTIDSWTCKNAQGVIVLSNDMKKSLCARGVESNVHIINNFPVPDDISAEEVVADGAFRKHPDKFRILFAGNIGRFQGLDCMPEAMGLLVDYPDIELVFLGDGKRKQYIKEKTQRLGLSDQVVFIDHVSASVARSLMRDANFGLVSLSDDIYRYAFPSKMVTYLENGCPLLVVMEPDSELAKTVTLERIGFCASSKSAEDIAGLFITAYKESENDPDIRSRCRKYVKQVQSEIALSKLWIELIANTELDSCAS